MANGGHSTESACTWLREPQLFSGRWRVAAPGSGFFLRDALRVFDHMPAMALLEAGCGRDEGGCDIDFIGYPLLIADGAETTIASRLTRLMERTTSVELWMGRHREARRMVPDRTPDLTLDRLWPFIGTEDEEAMEASEPNDVELGDRFREEELRRTVVSLLYAMGAGRVDEPSGMVMADGCPTNGIFATFPEFHANVSAFAFPAGHPLGAREISAALERAHARDTHDLKSATYPWIVMADTIPEEIIQMAAYARVAITDLRGLMTLTVRYGVAHK